MATWVLSRACLQFDDELPPEDDDVYTVSKDAGGMAVVAIALSTNACGLHLCECHSPFRRNHAGIWIIITSGQDHGPGRLNKSTDTRRKVIPSSATADAAIEHIVRYISILRSAG